MTSAQLKPGAQGKSKLKLKAKSSSDVWPAALFEDTFVAQDSKITVRLLNRDTGACRSSECAAAKKNTGEQFSAKSQ